MQGKSAVELEMVKKLNAISFDSLIPGFAVGVTEDGLVIAVDLIMAMSGKNRNDAAHCLRSIPEDIFSGTKFIVKKLPGSGNSKVKCLTFDDSLELAMVAPGKIAKEFRVKACDILKRFFAGDQTLHAEIDSNARSQHPVAQMARQSLSGNKKQCVETIRAVEDVVENRLRILQDRLGSYVDIVSNPHVGADVKAMYESIILDVMDMLKQSGVRSSPSPSPQLAYIYCTASEAFPDLVKIGRSKIPEARMVGLNTGCAPKPHVLLAQVATLDASRDEKRIHAHFASAREQGEFFRLGVDEVKKYFETVIQPLYYEESVSLLRNGYVSPDIVKSVPAQEEPVFVPNAASVPEDAEEETHPFSISSLKSFLDTHLTSADATSKISTEEICDVFMRTSGTDKLQLNGKSIVVLHKTMAHHLLKTFNGCQDCRRMFASPDGLRKRSGYIGLRWKDGNANEHVAAVRATYSAAPLVPDVH